MARELVATQDNTSTSALTEPLSREVARPIFGENVLAIDYNFADKDVLDSDITFSRSSGATQTNSSGLVAYAPHNLIPYSEDFSNAAWNKTSIASSSPTHSDPLGGTSAILATTATSGNGAIFQDNITTSTEKWIISVYLKKGTTDVVQFGAVDQGTASVRAEVNLTNGTIAASDGSPQDLTITAISDDWYRCSISYTFAASGSDTFQVRSGAGSSSGETFYVFGYQVEIVLNSSITTPSAYVKSDGGAEHEPRFDYDHSAAISTDVTTSNSRGLLIEEARTNLQTHSLDFTGWSNARTTDSLASNTIDPSGGTGGTLVVQNSSETTAGSIWKSLTFASDDYVWSIYAKKQEKDFIVSYDTNAAKTYFNLATGQVGTTPAGVTAQMEDVGNGWYRCSMKFTSTVDGSTAVAWYVGDADNSSTVTDSGGVFIWGSQLEKGASFPSSLIVTTGASATRAADLVNVTGTNFSRFFKDSEGTFAIDAQFPKGWSSGAGYRRVMEVSDGSNSDVIIVNGYNLNSTKITTAMKIEDSWGAGGTLAEHADMPDVSSGEIYKKAVTYKSGSYASYDDGLIEGTSSQAGVPVGVSQLNIGGSWDNNATYFMSGWIRRIRYYNKRQSNTKLQTLTDTSFLLDKYKGAKAAHSLRSLRGGRDASPVCSVRRDYDSAERSFTANEISNGTLSNYCTSSAQTLLPLDVSCDAVEMVDGGDFTELVTNGDFTTDTTGWTAGGGATLAVDSSRLKITNDSDGNSYAYQALTTVVGKTYTVSLDYTDDTGANALLWVGTSAGGSELGTNTFTATGQYTKAFTATSTTSYIRVGANESSNGTIYFFDNISVVEGNWTFPSSVGWSTGNGKLNGGTTDFFHVTTMAVEVGKTYAISFDIVDYVGGANYLTFGGDYLTKNQVENGHYSYTITAKLPFQLSGRLGFYASSGADFSIDNVSCKEVINANSASGFSTRKINSSYTGKAMRCRGQDGTEVEVGFDDNDEISLLSPITNTSQNLLAYSEDFGSWTLGSTPERIGGLADPFGGNNAWSIQALAGGAYHQINSSGSSPLGAIAITANSSHTFSWYVKKEATRTNYGGAAINLTGATSKWAYIAVDETNGTATTLSGTTTNTPHISVTEPVTGWYRVAVTVTDTHSNTQAYLYLYSSFSTEGSAPSPVVGSARTIFGAQLEETLYESTGTEKITNGDFSDGTTDWATGNSGTLTVENGALVVTGDGGSYAAAKRVFTGVVGKKYKLTGLGAVVAGSHAFRVEVTHGSWQNLFETSNTSMTPFDVEFICTSTSIDLRFVILDASVSTSDKIKIDDISVTEHDPELQTYAQTPAISDDDSSTTETTLGGFAGNENMVTHSEDITNYWGEQTAYRTADVTFAPDGVSATADLVYPASTGSGRGLVKNLGTTLEAGKEYTISAYLKKDGYSHAKFQGLLNSVGSSVWFDLENGTVGSPVGGGITQTSISWAGNNWWRCSMTFKASGTSDYLYIQTADSGITEVSTASGSSGMYVWGCQLNSKAVTDISQLYYQATTGTAKTADCMVVNWYDQNGGEDFVNAVAAEQPRIIMGSELVTDSGGKPSVYFDGGDTLQNSTLAGQNRLDIYAIQDTSANDYLYPTDPSSGSNIGIIAQDGDSGSLYGNFGTPSFYVNGALQSFGDRDDSHDALTGSTKLLSQHNTSTSVWADLEVGHYAGADNSNYNFEGKISEMVFFPNMDSSPKRFPIEQNMMNHFGVNFVDNGGFDTDTLWNKNADWTISGGTANSDGSGVGRVYQHAGITAGKTYKVDIEVISITSGTVDLQFYDGSFQTITSGLALGTSTHSFTVPSASSPNGYFYVKSNSFVGSIDNVSIKEYGVSGFVTKLYDQTSNNCHATQDTAAYQPKLVAGGDLITSGGKPAWEHVTASNMELFGKIQAARLDAWFVAETSDDIYMYPANYATVGDHGFVVQDGSTHTTLVADYGGGNEELYVNGTLITGAGTTRDEVHTALNGRKLVHHQDADTADWTQLQMGSYATFTDSNFNFQGKFSEWVWYDSDQSSNRTGIESNINTHYTIY